MNNAEIYKQWVKHQELNNMPKPLYPVEAYTQETIDLWKKVMNNKGE